MEWRIYDGDDFVTVIYRPQSSVKSSVKTVDKTVDKDGYDANLESTDERILSILSTNPRCSLDEVARVLEFTKRGVEKAVKRLRQARRLQRVGGKKLGHWEVLQ